MSVYRIAELKDKAKIQAFLNKDTGYAAYALGSLEPPHDEDIQWIGALLEDELKGLALIDAKLTPSTLFLMGNTAAISALLLHGIGPKEVYFNARPEQQPLLETTYELLKPTAMYRMRVTKAKFKPAAESKFPITRLDESHLKQINTFYQLGAGPGERIIDLTPQQIRDGYFYGIFLEEKLIATAGTHLIAKQANLAALGNVLTHPDYRGKGLGGATSNAVTAALIDAGVETIVLDVAQDNAPAIKIYEGLGYERVGPFIEGQARRR